MRQLKYTLVGLALCLSGCAPVGVVSSASSTPSSTGNQSSTISSTSYIAGSGMPFSSSSASTSQSPGVITLSSAYKPTIYTGIPNYAYSVKQTSFQYSQVEKGDAQCNALLADKGLIANTTAFAGLREITVSFRTTDENASVLLYYGNHVLPMEDKMTLASDTTITFDTPVSYVLLQATGGKAYIDSVVFTMATSDDDSGDPVATTAIPQFYVNTYNPQNKNSKPVINSPTAYVDATFALNDSSNPENSVGIPTSLNGVIKIRNDDNAADTKTDYDFTLDNETSFLGLAGTTNWVLSAAFHDPSSLHGYLASSFASQLDGQVISSQTRFVRMNLNGSYKGLFLLVANPDIPAGAPQTITSATPLDAIDFMLELNDTIAADSSKTPGVDYLLSNGLAYTLDYPLAAAFPSSADFTAFCAYLTTYLDDSWATMKSSDPESFTRDFDVPSLADYMLTDLVFDNRSHAKKSFRLYYSAAAQKTYFGPVWGYDSDSFSLPATTASYTADPYAVAYKPLFQSYGIVNPYFKAFSDYYGGLAYVRDLFAAKGQEVLAALTADTKAMIPYLASELVDDANKWYRGDLAAVFGNTTYVLDFITARADLKI